MPYTEEREFTFRVTVRTTFGEEYDGDEDGYEWAAEVPAIQQALLGAITEAAARDKRWALRFENRGRAPEDEVAIVLERTAK